MFLLASRSSGSLLLRKQVHGHALKLGLVADKFVGPALMTLYGFFFLGFQFENSGCKGYSGFWFDWV